MNSFCLLSKLISTILILYFRKYFLTLQKRIKNEVKENLLSPESSFHNLLSLDQTISYNINNDSIITNDKTQINTFNYIKNNVNFIVTKNEPSKFYSASKIDSRKRSFDSYDRNDDCFSNDKFETPKKIKTKNSSLYEKDMY